MPPMIKAFFPDNTFGASSMRIDILPVSALTHRGVARADRVRILRCSPLSCGYVHALPPDHP